MNDFSLIKQMSESKDQPESPMPKGVKYQQYEIEVDGKDRIINIPLRESDNFEDAVGKLAGTVTGKDLKTLLRQFRGIRG